MSILQTYWFESIVNYQFKLNTQTLTTLVLQVGYTTRIYGVYIEAVKEGHGFYQQTRLQCGVLNYKLISEAHPL